MGRRDFLRYVLVPVCDRFGWGTQFYTVSQHAHRTHGSTFTRIHLHTYTQRFLPVQLGASSHPIPSELYVHRIWHNLPINNAATNTSRARGEHEFG